MSEHDHELARTGILPDEPRARMMPPASSKIPVSDGPAPWRLIIQVSGKIHQTVGVDVTDKILIGRSAPTSPEIPDLDLDPFGASERGVSRRHAEIRLIEESLFVTDLDSTNGTKLNGFLLPPNQPFRLRHGDELQLGKIRLVIRFLKSPF